MKYIVTGASGEFGRMAVERLLTEIPSSDLILLSRNPESLAEYAEKGCIARKGDFNDDPEVLREAMRGGDKMLLISTLDIGENRQRQHRHAIEAAKSAGVRHIVYTSSVGVNPSCPGLSTADHLYTENLLRDGGILFTILRNSQYAEVYSSIIAPGAIAAGKLTYCCEDGCIAMISKADCVEAATTVLTHTGTKHENAVYEIDGPELLSFRDVVDLINELTGKNVERDEVDDEGKLAYWDALGVPREFEEGMAGWGSLETVSYERSMREGYMAVLTHHYKLITGHHPRTLRQVFLENKEAWANVPSPAEA